MRVVSDENTAISELQMEALKRKRQLVTSGADGDGEARSSLSGTLSNFLSDSSGSSTKGGSGSGMGSVSYALGNFISSMKDGGGSGAGGEGGSGSSKNAAFNATLKDFIGSGSNNDSNNDEGGNLASSETLGSFLDSTKPQNTKKNRDVINLSDLVNEATDGNALSVDQIQAILNKLKVHSRGEVLDIYDALLNSLNINADKLSGLDVFLAASAVLDKPNVQKINVDSEIIRTNFTYTPEKYWEQGERQDSDYYIGMDSSLENLPKVLKLMESIRYIKSISNPKKINRPKGKRKFLYTGSELDRLKAVDKTKKNYYIPNWAYESERNSIEMRVKQLNRLSTRTAKSPLGGESPKQNDFIKSLNSLLKFASTTEPDEKEGFFQGGMAMDELNLLRKKMSVVSINKSHFESNAENKIMSFNKYGFVTYDIGTLGKPLVLPSIDLGNFNISKRPLSTKSGNPNYGECNPVREAFKHQIYNSCVEALLKKAPDFRQNMYHGIFVYTIPDGIGKIQDFSDLTTSVNGYEGDKTIGFTRTGKNEKLITQLTEAYEKVLKTYYVRMQDITIPGANIEPYSIPFLNRKIKKIGNNFTENHKISINFTVDEMGLLVRSFNILTGQFGYIKDNFDHNEYADNLFPVDFSPENKGRLDLVVTYNDFRINPNYRDEDIPSKSNFMPATQNLQSENDVVESRNGEQVFGDQRSYRQFVLEDVKILGMSGKLQFKRDDAGKMTVPVDIIFRRVTTVDNNLTR